MPAYLLKRILPFLITLIVGTGLWGIFGTRRPEGSVGPGHYRFSHRRMSRNGSRLLRILSQPERRYTPEATKNRTTGVVKLLVQFNSDGTTTVIDRISILPDGLTEEAERIAEHTRFIPATINGQPITQTKEMNYIFSLSDAESIDP